ncbi:hypothetical protein ACFLXT_04275 [Chloroflexota bacterium]
MKYDNSESTIMQQMVNRPVLVRPTNTRYGKVPNVSLVPVKDCGNNSRYCSAKCYGVVNYRMYQATRDRWSANSKHFRNDPYAACKQVENVLRVRSCLGSVYNGYIFPYNIWYAGGHDGVTGRSAAVRGTSNVKPTSSQGSPRWNASVAQG